MTANNATGGWDDRAVSVLERRRKSRETLTCTARGPARRGRPMSPKAWASRPAVASRVLAGGQQLEREPGPTRAVAPVNT